MATRLLVLRAPNDLKLSDVMVVLEVAVLLHMVTVMEMLAMWMNVKKKAIFCPQRRKDTEQVCRRRQTLQLHAFASSRDYRTSMWRRVVSSCSWITCESTAESPRR
jgi:hypothetical protein